MGRVAPKKLTDEVNTKLSDIVIGFNYIELSLKQILCEYINAEKNDFVNDIIMHNSCMPFGTKLKILKHINHKENIGLKPKDFEPFYQSMGIRNAVAHSDNLYNFDGDIVGEEIVDEEYDTRIPIYEPYLYGPKILVMQNEQIETNWLDVMHKKFNEYSFKANEIFEKIEKFLRSKK